jgi:uncharacterized repeat protein (TIGR01451 family)
MKIGGILIKDRRVAGRPGHSSNRKCFLLNLFFIFLSISISTTSVIGSTGPTFFDGDRCPGSLPVEGNPNDEWGYPDFIDTDIDAYNNPPSTSNITHLWFFANNTDKNLYLALARAGGDSTGGRSDYAFFFNTDCNNNTGDTSPTSKGADYAISFSFQSGLIQNLILKRWQGTGYVDVTGTNLQGLAGSYVCTGNDAKFAEFRIGIQYLFNPCSGSGCGEIELISAESYAGNFKSTLKDVLAAAAPIYINNPPTADAGPDQVVCIGYETCFNGSNSTGGDEAYGYNDIVSYEWDFDYDGNESNFTTDAYGIYNCTNFTEYGPGTYWVSLRVCDAWSCCNCDIDGLNVTVIQQYPEITVEKIPDKQGPVGPGEKITYLIGLNNTGDANFTDVEVTDLKLDSLVLIPDANSSDNALNVSETWVYAGTYNVTEEDGCIGWVNNTASVNATTLCETGTFYSNKVSIQVDYSADFNLTKIAEYEGYPNPARPGTQINYTIWINNTGNVTLTTAGAGVYDFIDNTAFKVLGSPIESISPDGVLNVSETWKYEFNVTVKEFGIYGVCDGLIENFVYANFSDPCGNYIQKNYWENVSTDYTADFNITKTAEYEGPVVPGTQINYTIWINNTGDVTLTKVSVEDYLDGVAYSLPGPSETISSDGILNVSENWTYQFNITVTDDYNDICDRWINNTVVANFSACDIYVNKSASANVSTDYTADFNLTKIAEYEGYPNPARPGTQINYTIWINNTGNVTLTTAGAGVYDFIDNTAFKVLGSPIESISPDGVLNVSETWKYEFNVTVKEFGIYGVCDGLIENFVYANFSDPCGNYIQKNYWENVSTDYTADFNITKTAEYEGPVVPGTQINYTIWINNTGDVTLTKVSVEDYLDGVAYSLPGPSETISSDGILNVSENWTYQFNITVTDDYNDICDRWINNTVVANFSACDIYVNKSASANVSTDYTADFEVAKIAEHATPVIPGTQINYTIWINNTGNVNLTEVRVEDFLEGVQYTLPEPTEDLSSDDILSVSEKWMYEFNVTVTDDCGELINNCDGWINNTVIANFSDPCSKFINKSAWANVSTTLCQTADAGNDTIVCGGVAAKLVGNATGFDAVKWNLTEGCGGSLQWPIDGQPFNATYTPPRSGEIQCNLTFTATGPCPNVTDNATVYVVETPIAMIRVEKPSRFA